MPLLKPTSCVEALQGRSSSREQCSTLTSPTKNNSWLVCCLVVLFKLHENKTFFGGSWTLSACLATKRVWHTWRDTFNTNFKAITSQNCPSVSFRDSSKSGLIYQVNKYKDHHFATTVSTSGLDPDHENLWSELKTVVHMHKLKNIKKLK